MSLKLPQPGDKYDRGVQAQAFGAIERADVQNWKRGSDINLVGVKLTMDGVDITDAAIIKTGSVPIAHGGTGATTAAGARTNLGVTATGADTAYLFRANNLSDLGSVSAARTNLGLGTLAVQNASAPVFSGTVTNASVPGTTYSYDVSSPGVVLAASGKADFHNFSGLVLVTNSGNGSTALFLCGGGAVLVSNVGSSPGSMAGNSGINGYSYTAAVAGTYFFFVIRTRPAE